MAKTEKTIEELHMEKTIEELHMEGVNKTLESLEASGELTVDVGIDSFRLVLQDLFDQRWQNRQLQARCTELLEGDRASRRYAKTLQTDWENTTEAAIAGTIDRAHPELFQRTERGVSVLTTKVG